MRNANVINLIKRYDEETKRDVESIIGFKGFSMSTKKYMTLLVGLEKQNNEVNIHNYYNKKETRKMDFNNMMIAKIISILSEKLNRNVRVEYEMLNEKCGLQFLIELTSNVIN